MQSLKNGTQLGDFTIIRLIAKGGMGEVYEAHEGKLQRRVALKIISDIQPDDQDIDDLNYRFISEARTLARVNHPNIVTIYSIDEKNKRPFIAMEFVDGVSFRNLLEEFTFSVDGALPLFEQMLDGLKCLHESQILHRDLKPHNILLRTDGQVKILDFGIAKHAGAAEYTRTGIVVGTLPYMPPELRTGAGASEKSDLWSLGAIFFECLTGVRLVDSYNHSEIKYPDEVLPRLPGEMRRIISCMSAVKPAERYRTVNEALEDLKRFRSTRSPVSAAVWSTLSNKVQEMAKAARDKQDQENPPSKPQPRIGKDVAASPSKAAAPTPAPSPAQKTAGKKTERGNKKQKEQGTTGWWLAGTAIAALAILAFTLFIPVQKSTTTNPLNLTQPQTNSISNSPKISLEPLHLVDPTAQKIVRIEPSHAQTFTWSQPVAAQTYFLQVSTDDQFKNLVINQPVLGTSFRIEKALREGKYHWRLWSKLPQLAPIKGQNFFVQHLRPPEPLLPNDKQAYKADKNNQAPVTFSWKCIPNTKSYVLQWTTTPDFSGPLEERQVNGCQLKRVPVAAGHFSWRVRAHFSEALDVWSAVRQFSVQGAVNAPALAAETLEEKKLPAPKVDRKVKTLTLVLKSKPRDLAALAKTVETLPEFNWSPIKDARSYILQVASDKGFTRLLREESVRSNSFEWNSVQPGRAYWRVAAVSNSGKRGTYSEPVELKVFLPPPQLNKAYTFLLPAGEKERVHVEWPPVPLASKYLVHIGPKRNLADSEKIVTKQPKLPLGAMASDYYMKVAAANEAEEAISAFSETAKLTVQANYALARPMPLQPKLGVKVPKRSSLVFAWSKVENAESYTIEIAYDAEFKDMIEQRTTKNRGWLFEQAQLKSRVFWRIRANTFSEPETRSPSSENTSAWSDTAYFDIKP